MKKILITGFDPFGGEGTNPSYEAVKNLPPALEGVQIITRELLTVYDAGAAALLAAVREIQPDAVVCVGQAGGRASVAVERVGINLAGATIPDNNGVILQEEAIVAAGPAAYFSTLPCVAMVKAIQQANIPAASSYSAGTFVCNNVLYHLLHYAATENPALLGGFIHVPYSLEQAAKKGGATASMPLEYITKALEVALATIIAWQA